MPSGLLLLVDDDPQMSILIDILARRAGLSLVSRPDVETAWSALQVEQPELVLLDVNLPGKSGIELLHRRREAPAGARVGVALFSQPEQSGIIAAGWEAGADYLLGKNLVTRPAAWRKRIGEILEHLHGRFVIPSLGWPGEGSEALLSRWGEELSRLLDHSIFRGLGAEVVEQVLRRALEHGLGTEVCHSLIQPGKTMVSLVRRLRADATRPSTVQAVRRCFASLLDQVCCLLGPEPCAELGGDL
jgi:CheY-like chemotaxis protein